MALTYDGANGLFTRLGQLVGMMDAVRAHQNNMKTLLASVQAQYSSADAWMIDQLTGNIEMRISESGSVQYDIKNAAEKTLVEMCYAVATISTTNAMRSKNLREALIWLIRQMDLDSETINGQTISKGALGVGSANNGNGTFVYSFDAPAVLLDTTADFPNVRTEMIEARCIQDAQSGAILAGSEVFEIRGQPSYPSLDYRFPAGSGVLMRLNSITAAQDDGIRGANILTNSDLEDWTSLLPNQFALVSGTAGVEFGQETTNYFRGASGLVANVTGSVFKIRQRLGHPDGSNGRLMPDRPYIIAFAAKKAAGATGVLRVSLQDAGGTVLASGNCAASESIATLTTSWSFVKTTVRSPRVLPDITYLVIESTTAVAVGVAYIDEVVVAELTQIGAGGASLGIVAGAAQWMVDDNARYNFTNDNDALFANALDRLFSMYELGLSLPANYTTTESILDSLIPV